MIALCLNCNREYDQETQGALCPHTVGGPSEGKPWPKPKGAVPPDHLKYIQHWLTEMYQVMVDPVEEFDGNIEQLCALLLKRAREDRESLAARPSGTSVGEERKP